MGDKNDIRKTSLNSNLLSLRSKISIRDKLERKTFAKVLAVTINIRKEVDVQKYQKKHMTCSNSIPRVKKSALRDHAATYLHIWGTENSAYVFLALG